MKKKLKDFTNELTTYTEIFLALILIVVILIITFRVIITSIFQIGISNLELEDYLQHAMSLAIGVEFVKMLCTHNHGTVIEVLLFAIARQIIVDHQNIVYTLIGVLAIAGLFVIRKFLFSATDERDELDEPGEPDIQSEKRV